MQNDSDAVATSPPASDNTIIVRLLPETADFSSTAAGTPFCTCSRCVELRRQHNLQPESPESFFAAQQKRKPSSSSSSSFSTTTTTTKQQQQQQQLEWGPTTSIHWDVSDRFDTKRNTLLQAQLTAMHEHSFPVVYDDRFYNWLRCGSNHVVLLALQRNEREQDMKGDGDDDNASNSNKNKNIQLLDEREAMYEMMRTAGSTTTGTTTDDNDDGDHLLVRRGRTVKLSAAERWKQGPGKGTKGFFAPNTGMRMVRPDFPAPPTHRFDPLLRELDPFACSPATHDYNQIRAFIVVRIVPPTKKQPLLAPLIVGAGSVTPPHSRQAMGAIAYISTLGVRDDCRGRGLATELVRRALAECSGQVSATDELVREHHLFRCNRVFLHCLDTNHAALRLYANLGFEVTQTLKDYYLIAGQWCNGVALTRPILAAAARARSATGTSEFDLDDREDDEMLRRDAAQLDHNNNSNNNDGSDGNDDDDDNDDQKQQQRMMKKRREGGGGGGGGRGGQQNAILSSSSQQYSRGTQFLMGGGGDSEQDAAGSSSGDDDDDSQDAGSPWTYGALRAAALLTPAAVAAAMLL